MKATFKWNSGAKEKIKSVPDKVIYAVASKTLDLTNPIIPLSRNVNNGRLRQSTMAYGVKGGNGVYTTASTTSYAKYVWVMNDTTTRWSTSGTHSQWFIYTFKVHGKQIITEAIERNKLK